MNKMQKFAFEGIGITKEMAIEYFGIEEATKEPAKFGEARLAGEDEVFIYFPGDELTVGSEIYSDDGLTEPLVDGEYTLESGFIVTVADGIVADVVEPGVEEEAPAEDAPAEDEQELDEAFDAEGFKTEILGLFTDFNERLEKMENALLEKNEALSKANEKIESLSKASAAVHKPNAKVKESKAFSNYKPLTGAEKLRARKNK